MAASSLLSIPLVMPTTRSIYFVFGTLFVLVLAMLLFLKGGASNRIVNVHESVEKSTDVAKLRTVMQELGISTTVLHVIPNGLLYYADGEEVDLASVDENEEQLLDTVTAYPEEFQFFCSVDPSDETSIEKVQQCFEHGALGVKLYTGYSYTHTKALNAPEFEEFYTVIENGKGLLMLPVNTAKYQEELEGLLEAHPDMEVICPHYCLSSKNLERVGSLLDAHPNLYVDTSFGVLEYTTEGLKTLTENHDAYVQFFEKYQDRILFGTDVVVTTYENKTADNLTALYKDQLSMYQGKGSFVSALDAGVTYTSLGLSQEIQDKLFWKNWEKLVR